MSFLEPKPIDGPPDARELYLASFTAAVITYLTVLSLSVLGTLLSDQPEIAGLVLGIGAMFGLLIGLIITVLVVAPIGTGLGLLWIRASMPPALLGAATGFLTALILVALLLGLNGVSITDFEATGAAWSSAFIAIGSIAGWLSQRWTLNWPAKSEVAD